MSAQEPPAVPIRRDEQPSMRDLLASCAAANAVSTPPRAADAETEREKREKREKTEQRTRRQPEQAAEGRDERTQRQLGAPGVTSDRDAA